LPSTKATYKSDYNCSIGAGAIKGCLLRFSEGTRRPKPGRRRSLQFSYNDILNKWEIFRILAKRINKLT
jgi:hypothetical protein